MVVCHCKAVCERRVRAAVRAGARCVDSVANACGAGTGCGGCHPVIEEVIAREQAPAETIVLPELPGLAAR